MNKAKAYRELQRRQLKRSDEYVLTLYTPENEAAARRGLAVDLLRRPSRLATVHTDMSPPPAEDRLPKYDVWSPAFQSNKSHFNTAMGLNGRTSVTSSMAARRPPLPLRLDNRPSTTPATVVALTLSTPAAGGLLLAAHSPQNGHRTSAASASESSGRSNGHKAPLASEQRGSGAVATEDSNGNNPTDGSTFADNSSKPVSAQFPTASKMRQILSEIDSYQHEDKPAGIMKRPQPLGLQPLKAGLTRSVVLHSNGPHLAAGGGTTATRLLMPKSLPSKTSEKDPAFSFASSVRRTVTGKQVSFVDAQAADGNSTRDAIPLNMAPASDQPLLLTSRNLEMYMSVLTSSALSQPSSSQDDRVAQWVKDRQQNVQVFHDIPEAEEDGASAPESASDAGQGTVNSRNQRRVT